MRLSGGMTVAAALTFVNCAGSYAATRSELTKLAKAAVPNDPWASPLLQAGSISTRPRSFPSRVDWGGFVAA
jgi:hypothetical protein